MAELTSKMGTFLSAGVASPAPSIPSGVPAPEEPARPGAPPLAPKKSGPRRWSFVVLLLLLVGSAALWNVRRQELARQSRNTAAPTGRVFRGNFERSIRAGGSTTASNFAAIIAPRQNRDRGGGPGGGGNAGGPGGGGPGQKGNGPGGPGGGGDGGPQMVIVKLAASGTMVKKGELVAQFDPQWEIDHTDDAKANLLQLRAGMDKRKAELAIDNEVFEQQLRAAQADQDKARLDLKTAEVRSLIDAEKLKLAVQETEARYKQLLQSVKLRATSQEAEIRELDMRYRREETHIDRHVRNIERASVRAPIDGLVVMQTVNRREQGQISQVQEGDQVAPGTYFMQIVDLSSMVMGGTVNQADSHMLALGQKAVIRLEAYPDLELPGRVISIGAMASAGSGGRGGRGGRETYVRQVPIKLALEGTDPRVIPDLSASADIHLKVDPGVLQVPRSAVLEQDGKKYVRVKEGDMFQNREVQLGDYNHTHHVVTAGLNEGDEVALR